MPPKIRELIEILEAAGFKNSGGKGSHRNYKHFNSGTAVTVPGKLGEDAKHYLIRAIKLAIQESKNEDE
jgi:predicted RNA binding protein YcfA (HicA-like mRNA interferase family)